MDKERKELIVAAMRDMIANGKDLGTDGKPNVPVLKAKLGMNVTAAERDECFEVIEADPAPTNEETTMATKTKSAPDKRPNVDVYHLEPIVQITARLMRSGRNVGPNGEPGSGDVARHVGSRHSEHVTPEVVRWAIDEAKRRSPALDQVEIAAQAMK